MSRLRSNQSCTRVWLLVIGMFCANAGTAQSTPYALSENDLREIVLRFHPVAREGLAIIRQASGERGIARGAFDPRIQHEQAEKTVDGIEYYGYRRTEWQVPTWFGIEVRGGWEYLQGTRTPETETLGANNFIGLSIPLLRGLSIDKRRADLRKANLALEASRNERDRLINEVLGEALIQYWDWVRSVQLQQTIDSLRKINLARLNLIQATVLAGDRPAADTLEAYAQLIQWEGAFEEARLNRLKTQWKLSDHLWTASGEPFFLPAAIEPDPLAMARFQEQSAVASVDRWIESLPRTDPEWIGLNYQLKQFQVDRRFYRQELLPSVRFEYNQLGKENNLIKTLQQPWWQDQFQYGLKMSIPLRLSAERGRLRAVEGKIQQTQWKQDWRLWKTTNRIRSIHAELTTLLRQSALQQQLLKQYGELLEIEWIRFRQGESSLFLINARESRYQDSRQKLLELQFRYRKAWIELDQVSGRLARYAQGSPP